MLYIHKQHREKSKRLYLNKKKINKHQLNATRKTLNQKYTKGRNFVISFHPIFTVKIYLHFDQPSILLI